MSDTAETTSPAAEAWMAGDMQRAQELSQPIPDEVTGTPPADVQPWLKNHLAAEALRDNARPNVAADQAAAETAMISNAASKLSEIGPEGASLVQEWGGHTSADFKENLAYAKAAFEDVAKNRPDLIAKVDASGLGNDPAVLKILSELGRQKAHTYADNTVSSRRSQFDEPRQPLPSGNSAAQRELDSIYKKTPPGTEGYRDRAVQSRIQQLQEMIHGTGPAIGHGGRTA
ncbi:hypothetical protein IVB45_23015 [Bradyrhizobium sp. 4]|uniref:hypothetical protein n=1 Tax=unclassified Bradyrhizobium TaxID=2631580 RepID=UPI001FFA7CBD|nr:MULTISPECIES: hypothetical protein [unclassified Bradyrhizobium]MCK1402770.1 hypothetical protein [Bradyrhizobium sp. 39]MCK1748365.1 hypothetical protein [Bradyrhizobium sp. 135]UPJ32838.1 hypothetical protein IVB45_23015 [Bradyrhizobium sp. 4]